MNLCSSKLMFRRYIKLTTRCRNFFRGRSKFKLVNRRVIRYHIKHQRKMIYLKFNTIFRLQLPNQQQKSKTIRNNQTHHQIQVQI